MTYSTTTTTEDIPEYPCYPAASCEPPPTTTTTVDTQPCTDSTGAKYGYHGPAMPCGEATTTTTLVTTTTVETVLIDTLPVTGGDAISLGFLGLGAFVAGAILTRKNRRVASK